MKPKKMNITQKENGNTILQDYLMLFM